MNSLSEIYGFIVSIVSVVICIRVVYKSVFERWSCKGCGKTVRGSRDTITGFQVTTYCSECCGWRRISQAEYNRSFGIKSNLKVMK